MSAKILRLKAAKSEAFEPCLDSKDRPIPYFFRHRATGMIYFRRKFAKLGMPQLFVSTGEKTIGRAKTSAEVIVTRHKNKHLGIDDSAVFGRRATKTFRAIADEVLARHTPATRAKTQANHQHMIPQLVEVFGNLDVNSITTHVFERQIEKWRRTKRRTTYMDFAKNMNLVMRYAYNEKYATHLVRFANPDGKRKTTGRVFTDAEIRAIWEAMNETTRDQFVLSYECMMRLREVLKLTWDRVDLKTGKVTLRAQDVKTGSKTGKGREFILSDHALARLKARAEKRNPRSPHVFPGRNDKSQPVDSNKTAWIKAKADAKVKGRARWHDLRHSAISKALLEAGTPPILVSRYAGVSIQTIERVYLHSEAEHTKQAGNAVSIFKKGITRG